MRPTYPRLPWEEVVMSGAKRVTCWCSLSDIAALMIAGIGVLAAVTADSEGNVYGADFLGDVRKFVKK
jgi:hypothetical protein